MADGMLRFQFNEKKGVEALTYIASRWPGVTAFFAAKTLFFAEKLHLNKYARPIVGDTFIAMPNGPVPSTLYDFIKGQLYEAGDPRRFGRRFRSNATRSRELPLDARLTEKRCRKVISNAWTQRSRSAAAAALLFSPA
jgi:uncharacterized phage-associated protein